MAYRLRASTTDTNPARRTRERTPIDIGWPALTQLRVIRPLNEPKSAVSRQQRAHDDEYGYTSRITHCQVGRGGPVITDYGGVPRLCVDHFVEFLSVRACVLDRVPGHTRLDLVHVRTACIAVVPPDHVDRQPSHSCRGIR